ncbi:hypothetical protein MHK_003559, partial [Candidatus Magnetomorum sp. HK-1]
FYINYFPTIYSKICDWLLNCLAKWGRMYKSRMAGTAAAHNRAVAGIGKRIIKSVRITSFELVNHMMEVAITLITIKRKW